MAERALSDILAIYRYPLYGFLRVGGLKHEDAEDVLHDFFAKLLLSLEPVPGAAIDSAEMAAALALLKDAARAARYRFQDAFRRSLLHEAVLTVNKQSEVKEKIAYLLSPIERL